MDRILAPELLDQVIDQLKDDKQSLLATSLSCKAMLYRSRYHLFDSLEVTILADRSGWSQGRTSTDPRSLSTLLEILDAPYSSMGRAIQSLIISFGFYFPQTLPTDLSRVRKNLPNVRTLHWRDDTWCDIPDVFKSLVFGLNIDTFIISGVWFQNATELMGMISMWPGTLQSVVMGSITCSGDDTEVIGDALIRRKNIHFQTLHSASTWAAQNLFSSLISSSLITIDRFIVGLRFPDEEEVRWVNGMLSKFGSSFSEVVHQLPAPVAIELRNRDLPVFDLQDCTNLRALHIQSIYLGCSMSNIHELLPLAISAVQRVISSIPNPDLLEEIRIRFEVDLTELDATTSNPVASSAALLLDSDTDNDSDCVPFLDQFARFDWAEFAKFLLDIPIVKHTSLPTIPNHSDLHLQRPRRIHIQLGAYPFENKLFDEIFANHYAQYVQYIHSNGLSLVERGGLNELVFSQVEYENLYEVIRW
ncbi:hypothetical protein DFH05DRAFT_1458461 [Lentinula detonsa]|uniref:Uncharacterized protein n=1 Tax=Lentinula detonsa TaxID=2804962 RepID=A0A9W8P388_9AGAR|nr:hypothetical protein DFH05DRAFT_1458461 [Lentinula detonsa]